MKNKHRLAIQVSGIAILLACGSATREPTLQATVDNFLKSCEAAGVSTATEMGQAPELQDLREFYEKNGDGEKAVQEHHDVLSPFMQFVLSESTGAPSSAFVTYLRAAQKSSKHKEQARLLGEIMGIR